MAGWNVLGPMPPSKGASGAKQLSMSKLSSLDAPTILVFGNEGEGLRTNLIQMLSHRVTVPSTNPHRSQGMDSLNVSTTAAILLQRLTENRTLIE
jgi:21S rRNA (GM2251-2'-O)-methyltransferase